MSSLEPLLISGGDERLAIDQSTGRNRYGVPFTKLPDEVWFASSTASPVSELGFVTAQAALASIAKQNFSSGVAEWSDQIRTRLKQHFCPEGSEVILTPSGTDAELVVLIFAHHLMGSPITNILVAPSETGSGVRSAAAGQHYLNSSAWGRGVTRGNPLSGLEGADIVVHEVPIRNPDGTSISAVDVDQAVTDGAKTAMSAGRSVLIHCLDTSKTGLEGLRRATAVTLADSTANRCLVVVDACQLRCTPNQIRLDLASGFLVLITGSKFAGGPPFSGALLVPPNIAGALDTLSLPVGLAHHTSSCDWPARSRSALQGNFVAYANPGLYARWEAALSEIDRFVAVNSETREKIITSFANTVKENISQTNGCRLLTENRSAGSFRQTIFPIVTTACCESFISPDLIRSGLVASELGEDCDGAGRRFHVGQPVDIGPTSVLRVCLSGIQISDVARRMADGLELDAALASLKQDVVDLFKKWGRLQADLA